ncbi:Cytochrome P450 4C1 [Gryllus bimaculatus]|nr:Cytochrome P450 4C1 [Gryllus bimaculatus]
MDTWTLFALVLLVLGAIQYYVYFWSRPARETSRFLPGPRSWPIFGAALSIGRNPVGWAGPYLFVLVADPVFMEPFLNSTVNIKKSMNYEFLQPWLGTGLLTSFGSKWKSRRKIITPAFHFKILEGFMESFNSNANVLISKWKQQVGGPEFDIFKHITLYTLDVICDAAMGVQMNVQNNQNCEYLATLQKLAATIVTRSISPWYFPEFIFNMSPIGRKQNYLNKKLHSMSYKVIEERKKELSDKKKKDPGAENENDVGQKKRLAFLDMLLQYNEDGGKLTLEDIREEVDTFMFEGHDTTSSGLSFCLWSLAEHPDCQTLKENQQLKI